MQLKKKIENKEIPFKKEQNLPCWEKHIKTKYFSCNVMFSLENTAKYLLSMALTFVYSSSNITIR